MNILGIDFGTKKFGLAIMESNSGIASQLPIMKNDTDTLDNIEKIIKEYNIKTIILGMPSYNNTKKRVLRFSEKLKKQINNIEIVFINEDNTSIGIKSELTSKKQKNNLDSMSAVAILTQWYSSNNF